MSDEESECGLTEKRMSNSSIPFISIWQPTLKDEPDTCQKSISMLSAEFNLNGPTTPTSEGRMTTNVDVILNEEDRQPTSDMAKLLMFHHRYGHIPFPSLQELAPKAPLPNQLTTCSITTCADFLYTQATRC